LGADDRKQLVPELSVLYGKLPPETKAPRVGELRQSVEEVVLRNALGTPAADNWPLLVRGLTSKNPLLRADVLTALRASSVKPKPEAPLPFRAAILATPTFTSPKEKWQAIELLRAWSGRSFGAEPGEWEGEWKLWAKWFTQSFPKEPPLPNVGAFAFGES